VLRDLFERLGGNIPIRALATQAIRRRLIPLEELRRCRLKGVQDLCKAALKTKMRNGLAFAKPVPRDEDDDEADEKDADPWKQLELFTRDELFGLIHAEWVGNTRDMDEVFRLADFCEAKYGEAPPVREWLQEWLDRHRIAEPA
jgi:hypothetical protein